MPRGNSTSPVECEISSPVDCPYCSMLNAPGEVNSHCAPGELSITSWLWNNYDKWTGHIVRCWVPPGKSVVIVPRGNFVTKFNGQSSLCPRGTQHLQLNVKYHYQWTVHIVQCWVCPGKSTLIVPQGNSVSPVGHEILSPVDTILLSVECPRGLSTPTGPQWNSVLPVGHEILSPVDIILFNAECTRRIVHSHCAPGELSITSWPWNTVTSWYHIV